MYSYTCKCNICIYINIYAIYIYAVYIYIYMLYKFFVAGPKRGRNILK